MKNLAKEIIKQEILDELMLKERLAIKIKAIVSVGSRTFFTLKSKDRKNANIEENELIVIRCNKNNKKYEFIGKTKKWGKINIPLEISKFLNLINHELIDIELIKNSPFNNFKKEGEIDLKEIVREKGFSTINRNNKFITLYKKQQTPITIRRYIKIGKEIIEAIYLMHGDGHYKSKLFFSNTNYELHKFIIKNFEKGLDVPKDLWKFRVNHSKKELVGKSINFWSERLQVKKTRFYETKKLSKFNTKEFGDLRIIIDNLIVAGLFRFLIKEINLKSYEENIHALNGILNAEGSAQPGKKGLHKITISFNQDEKLMFKKLLENSELDIFEIEQNSRFCIRGWEKQYYFIRKFLDFKTVPFNGHVERRFNTVNGFLEHSYTKTLMKYLNNIEDKDLNYKELAKKLNQRTNSVLDTLNKERYKKFILIKNKMVKITEEGINFIKYIEELEIILKSTTKEYNCYIYEIEKFNQEVKNEQTTI